MDAPNFCSCTAPTNARISPTRKLISATIPNAWGPHSCMTRNASAQRNCARPRNRLRRAVKFSPRNVNIANVSSEPLSTRLPRFAKKGVLASARLASFLSGTAWARRSNRRTPSGSPSSRNSTLRARQNSAEFRIKATRRESQPVSAADSNATDLASGSRFSASRTSSMLGNFPCSR